MSRGTKPSGSQPSAISAANFEGLGLVALEYYNATFDHYFLSAFLSDTDALDSGRDGSCQHGVVEPWAGDVVRVGEHPRREPGEREAEAVFRRPDEGHTRLDAAEARGLLLEAQPLEDRNDGGHERLADQQLRASAVVEERDTGTLARQEDGQRGTSGTGADDGHSHRQIFPLGVLGTASTTVNSSGTL